MAGQRTHGTGGVFRRKKNGKYLPNWYIAYYNRNGRQQQESTRQPLKAVAERELRKKLDDVERGVPVEQSRKLRYENIRKSLITEYKNNHVGLVERRNGKIHGLDYLDEFFANILVKNITSPLLREFIAKLQSGELQRIVRENNPKEKRAVKPMGNGTINRVLALLRKAMNIARKDALIHAVPGQRSHGLRGDRAVQDHPQPFARTSASADDLPLSHGMPCWCSVANHLGDGEW